MLIGYARVTREHQDRAAQEEALVRLGVDAERIFTDQVTGRRVDRPGLAEAIAAARSGDAVVVTRLARLAQSVSELRDISGELHGRGVALRVGQDTYAPGDSLGRFWVAALASLAEFESELRSQRTREGLAVARERGRLKGRQPSLTAQQHQRVYEDYESGGYTVAELADDYGIGRATVYRAIGREKARRDAGHTVSGDQQNP